MKLSSFLLLLPAVALAAPSEPIQNRQAGAPAELEPRKVKNFLKEKVKWCDKDNLHWPAWDEFQRIAKQACSNMYGNEKDTARYGYRRSTVQAAVYDWPTTRPVSFEIWNTARKYKDMPMDKDKCIKMFTESWNGEFNLLRGPCKTKRTSGEDVILIRSYSSKRHEDGYGDIEANANFFVKE